ncbi:hypothetical protein [Uliginosibacterium sp. 31-12]|uniref:hypothetical protein n=1 Tax=Uliginosibacterium sp. 31-12 TaxID=3062781 RepID=UPI0026E14970|nr:hypothetical protein [Uliginosibacterium sp. 31-12]MDO6388467.1 hypothetical protein [Uliginosibacterium sp. 31-12]
MKKLSVVAFLLFVLSAVAYLSFSYGARYERERLDDELAAVQASLWFNHLLDYREIEAHLVSNCNNVALEKTRYAIAGEMRLLSEFYKEHPNSWVTKYISERDGNLVEKLQGFRSPFPNPWQPSPCK